MQLTEVLVAVAIFSIPLTSTVQLVSQKHLNDKNQFSSQNLAKAIERDRLAIQTAWMQLTPTTCPRLRGPEDLQTAAQTVPVWIRWSSSDGTLLRQRLYTPMGLGLCW
jgi:hypothetical protein